MSQSISFDGVVHEFPDDFSQQEIQAALKGVAGSAGASASPPAPSQPEGQISRFYRQYLATPAAAVGSRAFQFGTPAGWAESGARYAAAPMTGETVKDIVTKPGPLSQFAGEFWTPSTPTQAALGVALPGAQKVMQAAKVIPALSAFGHRSVQALGRVLTGGAVGEVGGELEGRPIGEGAAWGAGPIAAIEAGAPALGKMLRSAPWAKGIIAGRDAAAYGRTMGELSPPLAGARTVGELRALASGPGPTALGEAKGAANQAISTGLGEKAGALEIPSLSQTVPMRLPGGSETYMQPVVRPMTLQEANDELSKIGARAFSRNPLDRTFNGIDQRQKYGEVYNDILTALDEADPSGKSSAAFEKAQQTYKAGLALLKPLQSSQATRVVGNDIQFNTPYFQQWVANPRTRALLENKLGPEGLDALTNVLTRGGPVGAKDVLPPGAGRFLDALTQTFGRGANTGSMQALGVPLRTIFPNIGAEYAGRAPFSLGPVGKTAADIAALRAAGVLLPPAAP